ncbi:MAG: hypothetical protein OXR67_03365 [Chloroflexota bacterium]|nr:hypothetical protein [Chloroflexota bacterium]
MMQALLKIADMPVIFPVRLRAEDTIERAFEMETVDYVVKPFSPTELAARVQAALRRWTWPTSMAPSEPCVRGDLTIDYAQGLVIVAGEPVRLTAIEYDLPREFSAYAGRGADSPAPTAMSVWQDRSRNPPDSPHLPGSAAAQAGTGGQD